MLSIALVLALLLGVFASSVKPSTAEAGTAVSNDYLSFQVSASPNPATTGQTVTWTFSITNKTTGNDADWSSSTQQFGAITGLPTGCTLSTPSSTSGWSFASGYTYVAPGKTATLSCTTKAPTASSTVTPTLAGMQTYTSADSAIRITDLKASETLTVQDTATPTPTASPTVSTSPAPAPTGPVSSTGKSLDGRFTITKTADKASVAPGGQSVTYTYTVKNISTTRLYVDGVSDDKCSSVTPASGLSQTQTIYEWQPGYYDYYGRWVAGYWYASSKSYLDANQTATYTCTQAVTQTTKNTATATMIVTDSYRYAQSYPTASTNITVSMQTITGSYGCDVLWASAGSYGTTKGSLGVIDTTAATKTYMPLYTINGDGSTYVDGSAASAVDPTSPNKVYYIPRATNGSTYTGLWVYDSATGTKTQVTTTGPSAVRMGVAPDGSVWVIDNAGEVQRWKPGTTTWERMGSITLSNNYTFATGYSNTLGSGDLVFDGLGNMWMIGSDMGTGSAYLYTASWADLTDKNGSIKGSQVGDTTMGKGEFNGIAFTTDGTLWATTRDTTNGTGELHTINKETGTAKRIGSLSRQTEDLGSCALPKPELRVTKEVSPSGPVAPGDRITYTIKVENLGTLSTTNTTLQDSIPSDTTYVAGSAKLNGQQINTASTFPYTTAKLINSPGAGAGMIAPQQAATITFDVIIKDTTQTQVCNQGLVSFVGADEAGVKSDDPNKSGGSDPTCSPVKRPVIELDKTGSTEFLTAVPMDVVYTYDVTNPGTEDLKNVKVTDDKCPVNAPNTPLAAVLAEGTQFNIGDLNKDNLLQPDEKWQFTCKSTLNAPVKNTAITTGIGVESGKEVTDTDIWEVKTPTVTIDKKSYGKDGGTTVKPGDIIDYSIVVTNKGTADQTNVTVNDVLPEGVTYVDGTAQKTYWSGSPVTETKTGTITKTLPSNSFDSTTSQTFTVASTEVPAGATVTGYKVTLNGTTNYASVWDSYYGRYNYYYGNQYDVYLTAQAPWGNWFAVDDGTRDSDNNEFGSYTYGTWNTVTRTGTGSGSPVGTYTLNWGDRSNSSYVTDQTIAGVTVELTYKYTVTSGSRSQVTNAAHAPSEMVTAADGVTLKPGESMTVTFQGLVGENAPADITNTASTIQNLTDKVTDKVLQPAFSVAKTVGTTGTDAGEKATVNPDGTLSANYVVTVKSTGEREGIHPAIVDTPAIPAGFTISSVTMKGADGKDVPLTATDGKYTIPAGTTNMAPGTSVTYAFTVNYKVDIAKVDWTTVGECQTAGAGDPAKGVFNSVTMDGDTDGSDNNDACVPVESRNPIQVLKLGQHCDVGIESCAMDGAAFQLFTQDPSAGGVEPIADGLVAQESEVGLFKSVDLAPGTYWIVETKAPTGHTLLPDPIQFTLGPTGITLVDVSGSKTVTLAKDDTFTIEVLDPTKPVLPAAGGPGALPFVGAGIAIMIAAGLAYTTTDSSGRRRQPKRAQA